MKTDESKTFPTMIVKREDYSGGSRGGALGAYAPPFKNSKKMIF